MPCSVFLESINHELALNSLVADSVDRSKNKSESQDDEEDKIYSLSKTEKELLISYRVLNSDKQKAWRIFSKAYKRKVSNKAEFTMFEVNPKV